MEDTKFDIRLFIKDVKENEFDNIKDIIVSKRKVIIKNIEYRQIKCYSKDQLIELLKYYSIDLKEGYDKNYKYTNNGKILFDTLKSIIYYSTYEILIVFLKIFKKTLKPIILYPRSPYVGSFAHYINDVEDPRIYKYFINDFMFKCEENIPLILNELIYHNFRNDDLQYDNYLELILLIESKFTMESIMEFFDDFNNYFETIIENNIQFNNYKCLDLIIQICHKYFPNEIIQYGPSIARAIMHNRTEIAEMLINWYLYDCDDFKSDDMIEIYPHLISNHALYIFKYNMKPIDLKSLKFLHDNVVNNNFYSKKVIQMLILCAIQIGDNFAFTYLITVFPYEAMTLICNEEYRNFSIAPFYNNDYKRLEELKEDFEEYIK